MHLEEVSETTRARESTGLSGGRGPTLGAAASRARGAAAGSADPLDDGSDLLTLGDPSLLAEGSERSPLVVAGLAAKTRTRDSDKARRRAVLAALESGHAVPFRSDLGTRHSLEVRPGAPARGQDVYDLTLDGARFEVRLPEGSKNRAATLARIANFAAESPRGLRPALQSVTVENGANPADEYWAKQYGMPGFTSAATAGGGQITFWHGTRYLQRDIFQHEMGHLVAGARNDRFGDAPMGPDGEALKVPPGWPQAAARDGRAVSSYAKVHMNEDFAETWKAWMRARRMGPQARQDFQRRYPARAALLKQMMGISLA